MNCRIEALKRVIMPKSDTKLCRAIVVMLALSVAIGCCTGRSHKLKRGVQYGLATWYGGEFHGRRTASGEKYNMFAMTAAHKTLPFNTWVRVTNLENGKSVVVRINDRGPFKHKRERIIDLSLAAARKLDMLEAGSAEVKLEVLRRR